MRLKEDLSKSLTASRFRLRNVRLLTQIYLRDGKFSRALDTLNSVPDARLMRDTGLVMMKVKACAQPEIVPMLTHLSRLRDRNDDYGDYAIYQASSALRAGRSGDALQHVEEAKRAPRANRAVLSFLQCACEVEGGKNQFLWGSHVLLPDL